MKKFKKNLRIIYNLYSSRFFVNKICLKTNLQFSLILWPRPYLCNINIILMCILRSRDTGEVFPGRSYHYHSTVYLLPGYFQGEATTTTPLYTFCLGISMEKLPLPLHYIASIWVFPRRSYHYHSTV